MLDVAPTEFLLVAFIALVVIGPKDLPKAMRVLGYWVGRARGVARQFRSGFDEMVREAELADMEQKWAAENERIMREHPTSSIGLTASDSAAPPAENETSPDNPSDESTSGEAPAQPSLFDEKSAVTVEKPHVEPAPEDGEAPDGTRDKAPS